MIKLSHSLFILNKFHLINLLFIKFLHLFHRLRTYNKLFKIEKYRVRKRTFKVNNSDKKITVSFEIAN